MVSNNIEHGFCIGYHSINNIKPDTNYTPTILQVYTKYTPSILPNDKRVHANTTIKVTSGHIRKKS